MKTLADAVAFYLDQYKAAKEQGRFITVDPEGDGDKRVIWVQDDGTVNPKSSEPGNWAGYKPKKEQQETNAKFKRADIGLKAFTTHRKTNKDGSPRKNSKSEKSLAPGVLKAFKINPKDGSVTQLTKQGQPYKERSVSSFEDAAKNYGFEENHNPSKSEIKELRSIAKELQATHNEAVSEIGDAMRQLFANSLGGLAKWQARARAARDIKDLERFGIDTIIAGQKYSDSESSVLPLIRSHAGYTLSGGDDDEEAVFQALRKPLPKPLPLADPAIVEKAGEMLADRNENDEDISFDPALFEDDPDYVETFSAAVDFYAMQLSLFDGNQVWKDQPRKPKGNSKGGQWSKSRTPGMQAAREDYARSERASQLRNEKISRKQAVEKLGGKDILMKTKSSQLSVQSDLLKHIEKIDDHRKKMLESKTDVGKLLRKYKKEGSFFEMAAEAKKQNLMPMLQEMLNEKMGDAPHRIRISTSFMNRNFSWLHEEERSKETVAVAIGRLSRIAGGSVLYKAMKSHKAAVKRAVKSGKEVSKEVYDAYVGEGWTPETQAKAPRKAAEYCQYVAKEREKGSFRLMASEGRKIKQEANKAVDHYRKKIVSQGMQFEKASDETKKARERWSQLYKEKASPKEKESAYSEWEKSFAHLKHEEIKIRENLIKILQSMPAKPMRKESDKPAIRATGKKKATDKVEHAAMFIEAVSGGSLPNMQIEMKTISNLQRSRFNPYSNSIEMSAVQNANVSVLVHEFGHAIDWNTGVGKKTKSFESQAVQKHAVRWVGGGCRADEVGSKNGFRKNYSGKYYNDETLKGHLSEVLATGVEQLYENSYLLAKESPEHFNFCVAALRNLL